MADVLSFQPCGNRKFLLTEAFTSLYIYIYIIWDLQSKRTNYISGKRKKRVNKWNMPVNTGNGPPNTENEPQLTLYNATYKMKVSRAEECCNLLNISYYQHVYETYHIHWTDTKDKSGDTLLETKIKIPELPSNKKRNTNKRPKRCHQF